MYISTKQTLTSDGLTTLPLEIIFALWLPGRQSLRQRLDLYERLLAFLLLPTCVQAALEHHILLTDRRPDRMNFLRNNTERLGHEAHCRDRVVGRSEEA